MTSVLQDATLSQRVYVGLKDVRNETSMRLLAGSIRQGYCVEIPTQQEEVYAGQNFVANASTTK